MNIGEIAEKFIRAAEVERASTVHVGPGRGPGYIQAMALPYIHDIEDKRNWRKEVGDKLVKTADPYADERKAFWERVGLTPTAAELRELDGLYDLLMMVDDDGERRALLAWARSKVGGKAFRRWCFQVESIHPETGRRRKDRALARIFAQLVRSDVQNSENGVSDLLHGGPEIGDVSDTLAEDVGQRDHLNSWMSDSAFSPFMATEPAAAFSWAAKRNELRRQRETRRRKEA